MSPKAKALYEQAYALVKEALVEDAESDPTEEGVHQAVLNALWFAHEIADMTFGGLTSAEEGGDAKGGAK